MRFYNSATGGGGAMFSMGAYWKPGDSRIHWSPRDLAERMFQLDATAVKRGEMSL